MSNQGLQFLNRDELAVQLCAIFHHWAATALERADFVGWAWAVAGASDNSARADREQTVAQLRRERDAIRRGLAERLRATSLVNLRLISQHMFLDWLAEQLEAARAAA